MLFCCFPPISQILLETDPVTYTLQGYIKSYYPYQKPSAFMHKIIMKHLLIKFGMMNSTKVNKGCVLGLQYALVDVTLRRPRNETTTHARYMEDVEDPYDPESIPAVPERLTCDKEVHCCSSPFVPGLQDGFETEFDDVAKRSSGGTAAHGDIDGLDTNSAKKKRRSKICAISS